MDKLYDDDAKYDGTEVTKLRFLKHWLDPGPFNPLTRDLLISYPFFYIFHSKGSVIVSFLVLFKTPVTANKGLAKLRDAVDNNKRLGNFTVEALKIIQPLNPTTAASTERSTSTVCNSSQKGDLTVKNDMHVRELLQSQHRWQQERQDSDRFNLKEKNLPWT